MDVNLWFAKNSNNEIVSILNSNKEDEYVCPICASKVIPKATESKKVSPHFAHIDVSKCNREALVHWWYKNKFIQKGDKFKIFTDKEIEFTCKDFNTEVTYQLESGTYRPDLVVETECGQQIVFEMANTNKKKVKDCIDRWIELDKIIVEVDIKSLQNIDNVKKFNALYYKGKCFNFNKRDSGYYNTIGKLKEEMKTSGKYDIEIVKKLDWFWDENLKFNNSDISSKELLEYIEMVSYADKTVIMSILKKSICSKLYSEYKENQRLKQIRYYEEPISKENIIKDVVRKLNIYFKHIDKGYKVELNRESSKYKDYYWKNGRKIGCWKVSHYHYKISLFHELTDWSIVNLNVTNRIAEIEEVDKCYSYLLNKLIKHSVYIKCVECNLYFELNSDEILYFKKNNLNIPKRCKPCRQKRKKERLND